MGSSSHVDLSIQKRLYSGLSVYYDILNFLCYFLKMAGWEGLVYVADCAAVLVLVLISQMRWREAEGEIFHLLD